MSVCVGGPLHCAVVGDDNEGVSPPAAPVSPHLRMHELQGSPNQGL